ncbi:SDR family oxidoreductase [Alteribacillus sp. JSM 102045]|uniref:SDR family oxidoreductase n=1 Tax=Alteribacillus sp. JSM 102045 TaxID=1562101 RepID=UPI0035BEED47
MKVLVAGANGHTGRIIVQMLGQHSEHEAYAMIRDAAQAEKMKELGAAGVVVLDLEGNVAKAPEEMDAVIFAAGSGSQTGPKKTISVDQEGAKKLIDASRVQEVKHFIMLSGIGAEHPHGPIKHYLEAKGIADAHLAASGLAYTIVRPGLLTFHKGSGKVEMRKKIENRENRSISREDVAKVMVLSLDEENAKGKTFELLSGEQDIKEALKTYKE